MLTTGTKWEKSGKDFLKNTDKLKNTPNDFWKSTKEFWKSPKDFLRSAKDFFTTRLPLGDNGAIVWDNEAAVR